MRIISRSTLYLLIAIASSILAFGYVMYHIIAVQAELTLAIANEQSSLGHAAQGAAGGACGGLAGVVCASGYVCEPTGKYPDAGGICVTTRGKLGAVRYTAAQWGLAVLLPASWRGYRVELKEWYGSAARADGRGEEVVARGPEVRIIHPRSNEEVVRQDIPIMVFTLDEWWQLATEKWHIGAAPIGPSELARNERYVFALPARYNYAFQLGWEEVGQIVQASPVRTFSPQ